MARVIMEKKYLLEPMEICSRGLVVLFPEPVNQKAEAVLISNGLTAKEHTAAPLEQEDIDGGTLILTMEEEQKGKIWSTYENAPVFKPCLQTLRPGKWVRSSSRT